MPTSRDTRVSCRERYCRSPVMRSIVGACDTALCDPADAPGRDPTCFAAGCWLASSRVSPPRRSARSARWPAVLAQTAADGVRMLTGAACPGSGRTTGALLLLPRPLQPGDLGLALARLWWRCWCAGAGDGGDRRHAVPPPRQVWRPVVPRRSGRDKTGYGQLVIAASSSRCPSPPGRRSPLVSHPQSPVPAACWTSAARPRPLSGCLRPPRPASAASTRAPPRAPATAHPAAARVAPAARPPLSPPPSFTPHRPATTPPAAASPPVYSSSRPVRRPRPRRSRTHDIALHHTCASPAVSRRCPSRVDAPSPPRSPHRPRVPPPLHPPPPSSSRHAPPAACTPAPPCHQTITPQTPAPRPLAPDSRLTLPADTRITPPPPPPLRLVLLQAAAGLPALAAANGAAEPS